MKTSIVIILILIVISCREKEHQQSSLIVRDTLHQKPQPAVEKKTSRPEGGLILLSDNVRLFGDTTIEEEKIYTTSVKFEPYISFGDFHVTEIDTSKAELDFSSNKGAFRFRTRIRDAYKADTVNFAGHYTFVWWGCGSPCQSGVIVDRTTGKIYDAPSASLGYDFKANSRLLIANAPDSTGFYDDCFYCKPVIYVLDEDTKEFIERRPQIE